MREKVALWVSQRHKIPYRFRKSFIKRAFPKILSDYNFEIDFYGMRYTGNTRDNTDRLFFMFGGCEKYMLAFMKDYCKILHRGDFVFLDVGAHVGNHSLFLSKYVSEIHAFEPNPRVRESLNSKIYMNKIDNITVHPIGLSDINSNIPFYISNENNYSFGSFRGDHDERNDATIDVDVRIGDDVMKERKVDKVDLVKVNAEGVERQVIEGLKQTIEDSRPMIIVEISPTTRKSFGSRDDFESIFPNNYNFYRFIDVSSQKSRYKISAFDYQQDNEHLDIVAVPKEKDVYLKNKV